jgi:hypothetical protein
LSPADTSPRRGSRLDQRLRLADWLERDRAARLLVVFVETLFRRGGLTAAIAPPMPATTSRKLRSMWLRFFSTRVAFCGFSVSEDVPTSAFRGRRVVR